MATQIDPLVPVWLKKGSPTTGNGLEDRFAAVEQRIYDLCTALAALKFVVLAGTTAATNIAVTGIKTTAVLRAAINLTDDAQAAEMPAVTSAGNIQFPTLNTSDKKILLVYLDI